MTFALGGLVAPAAAQDTPTSVPGATTIADERADWGMAVSVGADSGNSTLLLVNDRGFQLVAIDPFGKVAGAALGTMTVHDIRPGDRVDYALSTWGGIDIADMLYVTRRRQAEARY